MLEAKRKMSGRKQTVSRMYGESLTSLEFITRLTEEEASRQAQKSGGRKKNKPKTVQPSNITNTNKRTMRQTAQMKKNNKGRQ